MANETAIADSVSKTRMNASFAVLVASAPALVIRCPRLLFSPSRSFQPADWFGMNVSI